MRDYRLISAVTFAFGTDGINRVSVVKTKLINDGARIVWNVGKGFCLSRRQRVLVSSGQRVLDQHESEVKEVGGYGQDEFGASAAEPEYCGESDDHEHYQLDDGICTPPAMFVEMGLQMRRQLRIG